MGKLKSALGKTLSAIALIGVAAVGVAAVVTVGSVLVRKRRSDDPTLDFEPLPPDSERPLLESKIADSTQNDWNQG
jgi:hypothetical protein